MKTRTNRIFALLLAALLLAASLAGCSAPAQTEEPQEETQPAEASSQIADSSEMTTVEDIVDELYVPVSAEHLKNGTYDIEVDSSSSMFNIVKCVLTVEDDSMTAVMTMGGTGYRYIYMGTPEEAVAASEDAYILPVADENGAHTFTVPVEALDAGVKCAAFSDSKEKWYDRTLVFRTKTLALSDFDPGFLTTAESLGLADGTYTCNVTLSGGSGKAYVESPATLTVRSGRVTAEIVWSSDKYDFMVVDGVQYDPVNGDGNSTFLIPVESFDFSLPVQADTIAMSTPHLIDYTLYFYSSTIE